MGNFAYIKEYITEVVEHLNNAQSLLDQIKNNENFDKDADLLSGWSFHREQAEIKGAKLSEFFRLYKKSRESSRL